MNGEWNITEIKKSIAEFHNRGALMDEVVKAVVDSGFCAPIECEIFDYKETLENTPAAIAKLIRHIVSFYNSFGGYLLFGVQEKISETVFEVVGVPEQVIDIESLKAKTREYVGERIQINGMLVQSTGTAGHSCKLYLLFIPKRPENGRPPVHFLKDGPSQIFRKDEVYYRSGDECIEAKGPRLFELTLSRLNPYLDPQASKKFDQLFTKRIENNLPDRNFICPKFVGREECLDSLWRWLGDDLSHIKMLAGEGGLGKSSIAYEFADCVTQTLNIPFEQVIWLTAKRLQFVGGRDAYISVPETHYSTYEDLIEAIIERLPILRGPDETDSMPLDELKRLVRDGLEDYPSLVIVDDIDSLDSEQQRQVFELGFLLGSVKSKLLLTTRHNLAYSHDSAIQVQGFDEDEFHEYLDSLRERNILKRELTSQQVKRLHVITGGSPLFTESVCRLLGFQSFEDALKGWGKDAGERVRAAALDREVLMLSPEAKRVLLSAALLTEASVPEISELTGYPLDTVERCILELSSLFLLAGETLGDQPRFSVPGNTVRLVQERAASLVTDHKRLEEKAKRIGGSSKSIKGKDLRVGGAISQAQALMRLGNIQGALDTIDDAKKRIKSNHDLLGTRAEILMKFNPPRADEARRNAREAYYAKCRRPSTFYAWFEAEWASEHYIGAEEAARAAIENRVPGNGEWWLKLAAALASKADSQNVGVSIEKTIGMYFEASEALKVAIKSTRSSDSKQWEGVLHEIHDKVWGLLSNKLSDLDSISLGVDSLERMWNADDTRFTNAKHALTLGLAICSYLESPFTRISEAAQKATGIRLSRCRKLIQLREAKYASDTRHPVLVNEMDKIDARFSAAITKKIESSLNKYNK